MPEPITLYAVHGSHPCLTAEAAIKLKGLPYRRVDLPFALFPFMQMPTTTAASGAG